MNNWLDLSNVSNILRQTYVNGFLDVSGPIIGRNDVSFNQKLFINGDLSLNSRLFVTQTANFADSLYVKNYGNDALLGYSYCIKYSSLGLEFHHLPTVKSIKYSI